MSNSSSVVDLVDSVLHRVGRTTFDRGRDYAVREKVVSLSWDPVDEMLTGQVRGSRGSNYITTVLFDLSESYPEYLGGDCTCPMEVNCKHTVAVTVQGTEFLLSQMPTPRRSHDPRWDQILGGVLGGNSGSATTPLAILVRAGVFSGYGRTNTRLSARIARPGKRGGWVNGQLRWHSIGFAGPEFASSQTRILQELYRLAMSTQRYAPSGDGRDLALSDIDSPELWRLLERARSAGIELLHQSPALGPLPLPVEGDVVADVTTAESGAQRVLPSVRVGGITMPMDRFVGIGSPPHGVLAFTSPSEPDYPHLAETDAPAEDPDHCIINLVRLDSPIPDRLSALTGDGSGLHIPAEDVTRFAVEFAPRLESLVPVVSTDDSFLVPRAPRPTLELRAGFGADHRLDLEWLWRYPLDNGAFHAPLQGAPHDFHRNHDAELEILNSLDDIPFAAYSLTGGTPARLRASKTLVGTDTLRVATELLPLLEGHDDVDVVIEGEFLDYREVGDDLHIAIATDEGEDGPHTDWFDLGITVTVEGTDVPMATLIGALARGETHLMLDDGRYITLDKPELRSLHNLIDEARSLQDQDSGALRISRFQAGLWEDLAAIGVVERQADAWQRQVQGLLDITEANTAPPESLQAELRPYQLDGYRWLDFLWRNHLGGILADDMGLGKTVQSLALLCRIREVEPDGPPALILAPSSVAPNWASEAARFAPDLRVAAIDQTTRKSGIPLAERLAGTDVVITSYTLYRLDFEEYLSLGWSVMMLDEAQFAKNHQSKVHHCIRRLDVPMRVAITGTPMENNLMELWSLLSITAPGLFPNPNRFTEFYRKPIERGGDVELLNQLRRRIRPLVLRRTKEQVATDLPEKQEQIMEVELHPKHRRLYDTRLKREQQKILGLLDNVDKNRFEILRSLTMLRQLSLDAALVDPDSTIPSAKIDALLTQLDDIVGGGHKALVFSQFTSFLAKIRERLDAEGIACSYLDGSTRKRAQVIEEFTSGVTPVFLISLKAGGFGLNLTEADYCFILDPWWNPATEEQAIDRTHRIGQTRNVMVYRLISAGTIEDKVMDLKARKAELVSGVLDEGGAMSSALNADDFRSLLE